MSRRLIVVYTLILILMVLLVSCASTSSRINVQWTEEMFFKNAQEAMDEYQYKTALYYYEVFLVRYPENHQRVIAAEYERAFINFKMGNYKEASLGYEAIILKYDESPYAMLYHPRFRQLSEIGLMNIEKKEAIGSSLFWRLKEKAWAEEHGESLTDSGEEPLT
ncbi:MAG: hypothetical protein KAJ98_14245 [Spirochaetaceae bacterium]|nr:hypothetical protein [Spirochaetaceae bacterium]